MTSACDCVRRATLSSLNDQGIDGCCDAAVVELVEEMDDVFLRHGVERHALLSLLPVECWLCGMVDARDSHEQGVDR